MMVQASLAAQPKERQAERGAAPSPVRALTDG